MESRTAAAILALLALVLTGAAAAFVPAAPVSPPIALRASAINYNLTYTDPASDVFQLWSSNLSHVTDSTGLWIMRPSPGQVNLIELSSAHVGANIDLTVKVQTSIVSWANTTYEVRLYTTVNNSTYYKVVYNAGLTNLSTNHTGSTVTPLSGTTIGPVTSLNLIVPLADLGNVTAWNIDASTKMVAGNYTYEDFIWSVPGNPGSAPAAIQGHVTDAATGAYLEGVNVSAQGFYTTTNKTGYYLLPAVQGNYSVSFSLAGYQTASVAVSVSLDHTVTADAQLSKTPTGLQAYGSLIVAVVVIAAVVIVALLLLRRRKSRPHAKEPSEQQGKT